MKRRYRSAGGWRWKPCLRSQGVTIILIEQNARMALRLSHRAYILELGQIILEGNAKELISDEKVRKAYLGSTQR